MQVVVGLADLQGLVQIQANKVKAIIIRLIRDLKHILLEQRLLLSEALKPQLVVVMVIYLKMKCKGNKQLGVAAVKTSFQMLEASMVKTKTIV